MNTIVGWEKCILVVAIAAGIGWAAPTQALSLSKNGMGQVLLFPYYTVNSEIQTLISIVNTTGKGKATRLFFREGRNSRIVMELSIYLAPYDVWTGSVFGFGSAADPAKLLTTDNSCTVPALKTNTSLPSLPNGSHFAPFSNAAYTGSADDAGPGDLARTREGHFELIEMGEVTDESFGTRTAITPASNGVPPGCQNLIRAWEPGGYWSVNPRADIGVPRGGLYGSAYYIDALGGTLQMVAADAIENFSERTLHRPPAVGSPTLADANTPGPFNAPIVNASVYVDGVPVRMDYPLERAIDAVSAVLMADQIQNEFVTSASVGGASEWVATFPTKHFYTDVGTASPIAPFLRAFAIQEGVGKSSIDFSATGWTREGRSIDCINASCLPVLPSPETATRLSWASNVVTFNQLAAAQTQSAILGSLLTYDIQTTGVGVAGPTGITVEGALRMSFWQSGTEPNHGEHELRPDLSGRQLRGLPVQGFWLASYTNGQLTPGVLSNYSDAVRHQSHAALSASSQ